MADKREEILSRLAVVAAGISGVVQVGRNDIGIAESARPAIVILDGNEQAEDPRSEKPRAPRRVVMSPQIFVMATGEVASNVGTELNAIRAALIAAVTADATLQSLVGTNGEISYQGCEVGLARGRQIEGEMSISIGFAYVLEPQNL